jgi:tetratricopeptide (TPR) repeat protein
MVLLVTALISWQRSKQRKPAATKRLTHSSIAQTLDQPLESLHFRQAIQWAGFGKQLEQAQQYEAALAVYEKGLNHYPEDFRLWHEHGLVLAKLQQFEAVLASYNQAHRLRPHHRDLAHERGDTFLQLGQYEQAIPCFDLFLQYVPNSTHVLADRGYALFQLQRYSEALQSLNRALKSSSQDRSSLLQARYYQIETLRQLGELEAALQASQCIRHLDLRLQQQRASLEAQLQSISRAA